MQDEGDLHRTKRQNKPAHENALQRQIVEDIGNIDKISEEHGEPQNQHADQNNNPGPFQNITEPTDCKSEQIALAKGQSFDPTETDCNQVNLNINPREIFENEGKGIDRGRNFQKVRGRNFVIPT